MNVEEMKALVNYVDAMDPRVFRDDAQRKAATWSWIDIIGWAQFDDAKNAVAQHYSEFLEPITVTKINHNCESTN